MRRHARTVLCIIAATLLVGPRLVTSQTVHYAYDAAGRLTVVGDGRGDLAVYDYDAVGNLQSIRRVAVASAAAAVVIALAVPAAARRGAMVALFGKGFASTPAANDVTFNGARADVVTASPTRLAVIVPAEATTGPIALSSPLGAATSSEPFRVLGALGITPPTAVVAPGGSVRFTASGDGVGAVRWSVDGFSGGDAGRGTITHDGVYVAPSSLPADGVRIVATSVDDPAIQATARVTMLGSRPLFLVARAAVSVAVARTAPGFAMAAPLALRVAPIVTRVSPPGGERGETVKVTVTGVGFGGATRLELVAGTAADPALAVTSLVIGPDGSETTADIAIAADAALGPRIVRIVTPTRSSGDTALGDNLFTVR